MSAETPADPLPRPGAPVQPDDVRTVFAAVLGREPRNPQEMRAFLEQPTIAALGEAMLRHPELPERLAGFGIIARNDSGPALRRPVDDDSVRDAYEFLLRRAPESAAIIAETRRLPDVLTMLRAIHGSEEYRTNANEALWLANLKPRPERRVPPPKGGRPPRVLVFGAFGNGNLGDAIQAEAVARLLPLILGRADVALGAASWLDRAPYPSGGLTPWPRETIMDGWKLADFDLVLVGGGGLFAPVHFPLGNAAWVRFMQESGVPYAVLGAGFAAGLLHEVRTQDVIAPFLRGCVFASARTPEDVAILRAVLPDGLAFPDPVLASHALGLWPAPLWREVAGAPALVIVKRPSNPAEQAFLDIAARLAAEHPALLRIVALEPRVDGKIAGRFAAIEMIEDFATLLDACAGARLVVSARFHGCIAGIMAGAPTLGVGPRKCGDLFTALGLPEAHVAPEAVADPILGRCPPPPRADPVSLVPAIWPAVAEMRTRLGALGIAG